MRQGKSGSMPPKAAKSNGSQPNLETVGTGKSAKANDDSWPMMILLTFIASNFTALFLHILFYLPDHHSDGLVAGPPIGTPIERVSPAKPSASRGGNAGGASITKNGKCVVRVGDNPTPFDTDDPSAKTLHRALHEMRKKGNVRYDVVPAACEGSKGCRGVVHQLPSIPYRRRMVIPPNGTDAGYAMPPPDAVHNLSFFLAARKRPNEEDRPLYIYNPTLLPLDARRIDEGIISSLRLAGDSAEVAYVAAYRVSNFGNCHGPGYGVLPTWTNYLGLALLDHDLNIVRDSSGMHLDAVIDINRHLWNVGWDRVSRFRRSKEPKQVMQDCQLFASRTKGGGDKANNLILFCNEGAMPVTLERAGRGGELPESPRVKDAIYFDNTYGSALRLTATRKPNIIQYEGKNMHYFESTSGDGFVETWPGGPHEYMPMDFSTYPFTDRSNGRLMKTMKSQRPEPKPTFCTIDGPRSGGDQSAVIDRDSGSACCVPVRWKDGDGTEHDLLLGFSHRKTRRTWRKEVMYNYVSRAYAFRPDPPFDIVARSGFFCLGFARGDEAGGSDNEQARGAANDHRLEMRKEKFDCPRIHFVTSIVEKVDDESRVIISYGVNDCYPRMIEVTKDFLVSLLVPA